MISDVLEQAIRFRGIPTQGGNPHQFTELLGGKPIVVTAFEPDPRTFRDEYYYNASLNALYRLIVVQAKPRIAFWQKVSS